MNKGIFFLGLLLVAISSSLSFAGNSANRCVDTWRDGDKFYFKNECRYNIFVVYCSEDGRISGKSCGDYSGDKSKGTFYTHSMNLKPGETRYKWKAGHIIYGACKGKHTSFNKPVKDHPDGSFSCPNPKRLHD